jgi:hypothetical protein
LAAATEPPNYPLAVVPEVWAVSEVLEVWEVLVVQVVPVA